MYKGVYRRGGYRENLLVGGHRDVGDAVGSKPGLDGGNISCSRRRVLVNLLLGQPLAVIGALGVGDVHELVVQTLHVVLLKTDLGLDHGVPVGLAKRSPGGGKLLGLIELDKRAMLLRRSGNDTSSSSGDKDNLGDGNHCDGPGSEEGRDVYIKGEKSGCLERKCLSEDGTMLLYTRRRHLASSAYSA